MRLAELSDVSGVSPASIKFYLREGLLDAGERVNPTRASYGEQHVRRLRLITGLRSVVGLGLPEVRRIIEAAVGADDLPGRRLALLGTVQSVVLRLGDEQPDASPAVDALLRDLDWPDAPSEARSAVDRHLAEMEAAGVPVDRTTLAVYGRAADLVADVQLSETDARAELEDFILMAAVGLHMHQRLILTILGLAQASHSIRRYGSGDHAGPGPGRP